MTSTTVGREVVQIVEIVQPFCANTYGVSPCTASGASGSECFNTFGTCQDTANYSASTLSLYFSRGHVAERGVSGAPYVIPSLVSVSTSPTKVNLAAADDNATGLGNRAVCTIRLKDHPHTDQRVDPYVSTRSYTPYTSGSFWTKWLKRNKYRQNITIKVYEGYAGQALSAMTLRQYVWQSIQGPDAAGNVTITGKDILTRIEERKAQCPVASPGQLFADLNNSDTSFEVSEATESDYDASGTLRIGREVMTYTSRANSTNGVTFSGVTRGTDGTDAAAHSEGDAVQLCVRFTNQQIDDALNTLLATYGGISAGFLDTTQWATEVDTYGASVTVTRLVTEPTAVAELVAQLQEHCAFFAWWDERAAKVKIKLIRGTEADPDLLTEEANIVDGSLSIMEMPKQRTSQVWIFYGQIDPTEKLDTDTNWRLHIEADLASEGTNQYGEPSIRKIYAAWLDSQALAQDTAARILLRYVDVPRSCRFRLDAKDRTYWVGDNIRLSTDLDVDTFGSRVFSRWTIVSAEEVQPGEIVEYEAQDTTLYGKIYFYMASGAADYPGAATVGFNDAYYGDTNGVLSDGETAARYA